MDRQVKIAFFPQLWLKYFKNRSQVDSPQAMKILKDIEEHFGKPIKKLDANDVDELEKIQVQKLQIFVTYTVCVPTYKFF
jgi:hypothetical protein